MTSALIGYVGLGPGPELLPYFFALLGLIAAAIIAILQWPVGVLLRWLPRRKRLPEGEPHAPAAPEKTHEAGSTER